MFSIDIENRAESESTSTRCTLRVSAGSAQISSRVRSGPMPASDSATATFRLAGKPLAASRAVPSKIFSGSLIWFDVDVVLDQKRRAGETLNRLARHHPDRMDFADGGRRHRIEADQRAGRHHDLPAVLPRQIDQVFVLEQRAGAEHDRGFSLFHERRHDRSQKFCRRAFDDDIGDIGKPFDRQDSRRRSSRCPASCGAFRGSAPTRQQARARRCPGRAPRRLPSRSDPTPQSPREGFSRSFSSNSP